MNGPLAQAVTEISITGMTCEHCVTAVTEALQELDGVSSVSIQLNSGYISTAVIASEAPLPLSRINDAVREAGYIVLASRP